MARINLVVAGSRDLTPLHYDVVARAIDTWIEKHARTGDVRIVEGGARGADQLAATYSRVRLVGHQRVRADWESDGKAAGPIRNQRMIDDAHGLVVVRYPDSRGSADVLRRARKKGIPIIDRVIERRRDG